MTADQYFDDMQAPIDSIAIELLRIKQRIALLESYNETPALEFRSNPMRVRTWPGMDIIPDNSEAGARERNYLI